MYFEAYKKAAVAAESPTQTEYRLFAEITRDLEHANAATDNMAARINALFRNSQLWLTIHTDLVSENNRLGEDLKAGLISLAIWVTKFTPDAMRSITDLEPLISVNKQIMDGLMASHNNSRLPVSNSAPADLRQISI